jgi:hypothetical protein
MGKVANFEQISRRSFIGKAVAVCTSFGLLSDSLAQAALTETDSQAVALGYKADAVKIDKTKQPKYLAGQVCANCALYQGAVGSAAGGCPIFGGKLVAAKGWCNAWSKKG